VRGEGVKKWGVSREGDRKGGTYNDIGASWRPLPTGARATRGPTGQDGGAELQGEVREVEVLVAVGERDGDASVRSGRVAGR